MSRSSFVMKHFREEHYSTFFNPNTGFFARVEDSNYDEPFWSSHGPELLDIAITNWCDKECPLCYRKSDQSGRHMSLGDYKTIMRQAQQMHVFQVALGGGNPNQHPDFCEILRLTREGYGIVPNYTTNGRGLTDEVLEATRKYCGAVAVSAYYPYEEMRSAITKLTSHLIKTNIHLILTNQSINTAISWLETPPNFLNHINALIFLNYKPVGRYSSRKLLPRNHPQVNHFFQVAVEKRHKFRIGFDSCSVSGIVRFTNASRICHEGCEAGRFSLFVSENMKMYPCSFMAGAGYDGLRISGDNMRDIWRNGETFKWIREKLSAGGCRNCEHSDLCLGGCPLFEEINFCMDQHAS